MSDYQTDRLEEIEQWQGHGYIHDPADIAWLISEVRRYRNEESPHAAAKYWAEIQRLRAANGELQAWVTSQDTTIDALRARVEDQVEIIKAWNRTLDDES